MRTKQTFKHSTRAKVQRQTICSEGNEAGESLHKRSRGSSWGEKEVWRGKARLGLMQFVWNWSRICRHQGNIKIEESFTLYTLTCPTQNKICWPIQKDVFPRILLGELCKVDIEIKDGIIVQIHDLKQFQNRTGPNAVPKMGVKYNFKDA